MLWPPACSQGAFGALLAPATLSLLTTTFTGPARAHEGDRHLRRYRRGRRVGRALLGGFLTEYLYWRWVMYVNVVIAASRSQAVAMLRNASPPQHRRSWTSSGTVCVGGRAVLRSSSGSRRAQPSGGSGWTEAGDVGIAGAPK